MEEKKQFCVMIGENLRDIKVLEGEQFLERILSIRMNVSAYQIPPVCEIDVLDPTIPELSQEYKEATSRTIAAAQRHGVAVKFLKLSDLPEENAEEQKQAEATLRGIVGHE